MKLIRKEQEKKWNLYHEFFMVTPSKGSHFKRHCKKISLKPGRVCGKGENERKAEREGGVRGR